MGRLASLHALGQSAWLDFISRRFIDDGSLAALIEAREIQGVTSNPVIFKTAVASSADYDAQIARLCAVHRDPVRLYEQLAIRDIQAACDVLREVHVKSGGLDGFVSLEVSPHLAHDCAGTLLEARRLWSMLDRPNAMIKIPATPAGIEVFEALTTEAIHVNVTLLFSRSVYREVRNAYVRALEKRAAQGLPIDDIVSVASFFVSRVDTEVDALLAERLVGASVEREAMIRALQGRVAISHAKLAYDDARAMQRQDRWRALVRQAARPQRLLWASTSVKNPCYRELLYVDELIGIDTINTMPPETLNAFRERGRLEATLSRDVADARERLESLAALGIDLEQVACTLLDRGLALFRQAFDDLIQSVDIKRQLLTRSGRSE